MLHLARALATELLAPRACAACDARLVRAAVFCATCAATVLEEAPPRLLLGTLRASGAALPVVAVGPYGGALGTAIRRLKYDDRPDLAEPLSALLGRVAPLGAGWVTAVPLHPSRLAERRYNHAALLARALAERLALPFRPRALERALAGAPQAGKTRADRLALPPGTFRVRAALCPPGAMLLVDDVVTTGATARACADALSRAGAEPAVVALAWA